MALLPETLRVYPLAYQSGSFRAVNSGYSRAAGSPIVESPDARERDNVSAKCGRQPQIPAFEEVERRRVRQFVSNRSDASSSDMVLS